MEAEMTAKLDDPIDIRIAEQRRFELNHPELNGYIGVMLSTVHACDGARDLPLIGTALEDAYKHVEQCSFCRENIEILKAHQKELYKRPSNDPRRAGCQ
jgi:hypothetical protein